VGEKLGRVLQTGERGEGIEVIEWQLNRAEKYSTEKRGGGGGGGGEGRFRRGSLFWGGGGGGVVQWGGGGVAPWGGARARRD